MEKEVRIGIIGIGNMGSDHAKRIARGDIRGMKLTAAADVKPARRAWAKENLPADVKIYENETQLLDDPEINAVLIAVPHYDHPGFAIRAMEKGLNVMCEKPAGVYTKQVREAIACADRHPELTFAMMFNQRTNPLYIKMHEIVQSGRYGNLKRVTWIITDWYRTQHYYDSGEWRATWNGEGGGVLLNQCPHQLDLLQWICGLPVKVMSFMQEGKWHHIEVEDDVTTYLEFENGATGCFITTTGETPGTNRLEVDLDNAKIVCEHDTLTISELEADEPTWRFSCPEGFTPPKYHDIVIPLEGPNPQHNGVLQAFADHILNGAPLVADGREGIRGLMLSNAMHLSHWLGHPVEIPFDEDLFLEELNKRRAASKVKTEVHDDTADLKGTF
ncbi:MAG: Gfo/Idh/MocA family oxidoreductase [Lachnospiraceae bacterium]|jgi:predicted dehydrogenase|nr:Gfo/Idh/MocA family oxidoreductase [Lachnospiraceae bacterium]MCH4028210.1 Gfo/Idh/MocA family oxidoreductase [Lachnospiraceae bacterium]MCH4066056.1 Gfo/Idh/MocA family oxidoreductase [Lachnospiraceae bacterium]MCH4112090.1 Gfo/Idh/MocA family oxidoreductase [Lachnospiraceae bacterium]MCI1352822.1 Gfo/Idh/MocA family oxidoreductase [Lachnospiraceae bacterium]